MCLILSPYKKIKSFTLEKIIRKFLVFSLLLQIGNKFNLPNGVIGHPFKQDIHFLTFLRQMHSYIKDNNNIIIIFIEC